MRIEEYKPNITEYGFLSLLVSTIKAEYNEIVIEKHKLEKNLYDFYKKEDFNFLFEDICIKKGIDDNNYVDLTESFQLAYAWGLLSMIHDSSKDVRFIINLNKEEAIDNLHDYNEKQVNAMYQLIEQMKEKKDKATMDDRLNFNEEIMLSLYLELFKDYYNKGEDKYAEKYNTRINEGKMQCLCYIFQNLDLFDSEYGFSLNYYTPYSPGVLKLTNDINRKEGCVEDFYDEYYQKRKEHNGIYKSLSKYYSEEEINEIINITYILGEIKDEKLGVELLTTLHYFIETKCGGNYMEEEFYKEKMEDSYPIYKNKDELFKKSYRILSTLNLIKTNEFDIPKRIRKKY